VLWELLEAAPRVFVVSVDGRRDVGRDVVSRLESPRVLLAMILCSRSKS
jgi:hypothetical protein